MTTRLGRDAFLWRPKTLDGIRFRQTARRLKLNYTDAVNEAVLQWVTRNAVDAIEMGRTEQRSFEEDILRLSAQLQREVDGPPRRPGLKRLQSESETIEPQQDQQGSERDIERYAREANSMHPSDG